MNLRVQSRLARSFQTLDAFSNQFGFPPPSPAVVAEFNPTCIVLSGEELRFQIPTRSPTGWRVGCFNLWIQVQKEPKLVDFTVCGALIGGNESD